MTMMVKGKRGSCFSGKLRINMRMKLMRMQMRMKLIMMMRSAGFAKMSGNRSCQFGQKSRLKRVWSQALSILKTSFDADDDYDDLYHIYDDVDDDYDDAIIR